MGKRRLVRGLAIALVFGLLANGLVGLHLARTLRDESQRVADSHELIEIVNSILQSMLNAETGQRGYLLTEEDPYLQPFTESTVELRKHLDDLQRLTSNDPEQRLLVDELQPWVERKQAELEETVRLQDAGERAQALRIVEGNSGHRYMEQIRERTDQIIAVEKSRLKKRSEAHEATYEQTVWTMVISACVKLAALALFIELSRRVSDNLLEAKQQAELATQSRGEFLANMSHEIRTPMTAIIGNADILEDELEDPDNVQCVRTIKTNGRHLLTLINDILDLSKIDAGKIEIARQDCRVEEVLADVQSMLKPIAVEKSLSFVIVFSTPIPSSIQTDVGRLRQVLVNIVGNAIKFTDKGSVRVEVAYDKHAGELRFQVEDTGIGIPAEAIEKLFDPFEQVDSSRTRRFEGTGLGLAISERLAKALGGDITVTSQPGKGSVFNVSVNAGEHDAKSLIDGRLVMRPAENFRDETPKLDCRVLVVDDRRDIRFLVRRMVEKSGGEVCEASNGQEAIDILIGDHEIGASIDVCVMDMQMPVMDGVESVKRLRRAGLKTPIIALTANAMKDDQERCVRAGFTDYCSKPIEAAVLLKKIENACEAATAECPDD